MFTKYRKPDTKLSLLSYQSVSRTFNKIPEKSILHNSKLIKEIENN